MKNANAVNYKDVMQNLYEVAGKYTDKNLADAVSDVREMFIKYHALVGDIDSTRSEYKAWMLIFDWKENGTKETFFFDTIDAVQKFVNKNNIAPISICHITHVDLNGEVL